MYTQKQILHLMFTAAMYHDSPFGFGLFPHDQQITTQSLSNQSKQFDAMNTQANHVWIVIHKIEDTIIVKEAMESRGYKNLQQAYWGKPNHYVAGPVSRMTPVIEIATVGFNPDSGSIHWNVSDDPRLRPNFFSCPSVASLARDSTGTVINVTEKPPQLAEWLLGMFCKKGSNVLIVGTGAGGDVKGALKAGMNVIGVENDEKQYNQLKSEMNAWVARLQKEKDALKPKEVKPKVVPKTSAPPKPSGKEDAPAPPDFTSVDPAVQEGMCFSCDLAAQDGNPLDECSQCHKQNHVKECMTDVADGEGEGEMLVCAGCKAKFFGKGNH